jgi:hypothetical protein
LINSKSGVNVKVVDWGKVQARMYKALTKPAYKNLFRNYDQAMSTLKDVYLKNIAEQNAVPSADALGGGLEGSKKRNFFNEVMGAVPRQGDVMSNLPTAGYVANRKGGSVYQDLRIERIQNAQSTGSNIPWSGDMGEQSSYRRTQLNFQPAETIGETTVSTDQNAGYRILSKNGKFRLYGPDGSTAGIFDTQEQAKLKAEKDYATQARLQPEVDQQQRPLGDEVRQTAEAGGGNRIERGQEGQGEGGAVRQAGDVRFMPSDSDYLEAVNSGDTATAQRMVDEAAKAAGYTIGPVYHGTPTGGFNVFDKRMRGETSGVSRQAFSFTTDKKAAEGYSKRLGDEAVRLDAGLRVANDAMRMFDEDVAAQEYFSSKGYSSVDDGMLPEFDWGSIDDVPEFIKELRGYAKDLKPINKRLSDSFIEAAKVMTSTKAVPEVKRVFLRIPEGAPVFQATPQTLGQVMSGFSAENQPTKAGIVELPGNERIYYVADSSQVKLVDAITKDDSGNVIPLSQRFKVTSDDIRFMPDYSGEHKAPQRDSGAPLDNLKDVYPDDVYGPKGALYYGHASGDATDKAAIRIIQSARNKPDAPVKVFRAIPKGIQSNEINPGDWITTIKSYAVQHGEGALGGDYKILEKTVPAGDLYTNGDSIFEFGYDPKFMPETIQRDVGRNQDFATPPTDSEAIDALSSEKKAKFGAARSIKPGTQVAARIDIPAFLRTGKYVVAVHEPDGAAGGPGKVIGYDTVTRLQNPKFVVKPGVQRIYEGRSAKFPVATVDGKIMADRSIPGDLENYVPVGMDPKEHAYFYDKRTDQPVIGGSESVSVGNTVFVKNPVYGDPSQFAFMPSPDSAMPGAYSFPGGYRALPGKAKGSLRLYGPAGSLIGIAASLDEAQRIIRKKSKQ